MRDPAHTEPVHRPGRAGVRARVAAIDSGGECPGHAALLPALVRIRAPPMRWWGCAPT